MKKMCASVRAYVSMQCTCACVLMEETEGGYLRIISEVEQTHFLRAVTGPAHDARGIIVFAHPLRVGDRTYTA